MNKRVHQRRFTHRQILTEINAFRRFLGKKPIARLAKGERGSVCGCLVGENVNGGEERVRVHLWRTGTFTFDYNHPEEDAPAVNIRLPKKLAQIERDFEDGKYPELDISPHA